MMRSVVNDCLKKKTRTDKTETQICIMSVSYWFLIYSCNLSASSECILYESGDNTLVLIKASFQSVTEY